MKQFFLLGFMNSIHLFGWSMALSVIAGLVVLVIFRNKSKERKALAPLRAFAAENETRIAECDWWDKTVIGIGAGEPKALFFIRMQPDRVIREKIDLMDVSDCRMYKRARQVSYKKENISVVDRIELLLSFYDRRPGLTLEFYNNDYDSLTLTGELQQAQKWTALVKSVIKAQGKRKVLSREKPPAA